jgi:hypothetical protein
LFAGAIPALTSRTEFGKEGAGQINVRVVDDEFGAGNLPDYIGYSLCRALQTWFRLVYEIGNS